MGQRKNASSSRKDLGFLRPIPDKSFEIHRESFGVGNRIGEL